MLEHFNISNLQHLEKNVSIQVLDPYVIDTRLSVHGITADAS
jgi:hypothetical protein